MVAGHRGEQAPQHSRHRQVFFRYLCVEGPEGSALIELSVTKANASPWARQLADDMEEYLENCPESREALSASFDKLRIRHREVLRTKVLGELSVDVHSRLQDLSRYGGSKKAFHTMEPPLRRHAVH